MVRLPEHIGLQDLNDAASTLWTIIQSNHQTALRQWDRIRFVAFDESWFADTTVSFADRDQVILTKPAKTEMPARTVALYEDEHYRIGWGGAGYAVYRKKDNVMIGAMQFTTAEQARQHLMNQYPKVA
jgi:hypothetical protein